MTDPAPPRKPPRSAMTVRDMLAAIGVLALIVIVIGGVTRGCSFSPGGPSVDSGALPVVDAPTELRALAPDVPFALRVPAVPPGWRSNAVGQDRLDPANPAAGRGVRAGYLTPEGRYLRVVQSDGTEEAVLASETGATAVPAQGTTDVGGLAFVVYGEPDDEPIWIGELDGVRILITGSGAEGDYRALAGAVLAGQALPAGTAPG
ncbi:DUF4245 domain-containing protein [Pseudonocardia saturnea]